MSFKLDLKLVRDILTPHAMKSSTPHDPDNPRLHEEMSGEHRYYLLVAMHRKIAELEQQNTWKVVIKTFLPRGTNLIL